MDNQGKLPEQTSLNIAQLQLAAATQSTAVNDAMNRLDQEKVQIEQHEKTLQSQMELFSMLDNDAQNISPSSPAARQNEQLLLKKPARFLTSNRPSLRCGNAIARSIPI